jgi:hypothetical protein
MLRLSAHAVSIVLHPLLMPTWLLVVLLTFFPTAIQPAQAWGLVVLLIFFGMTFILPVLNMLFFKITGTISSFSMPNRQDRMLPSLLITALYATLSFMFYWKVAAIPIFFKLMVIVTMLSAVVMIGTFFLKISAHAVAACGLAGILLAMATLSSISELILPALVVIVLAGVTMSSRLLLNAHTLHEVGWGGVLGFAVGFAGMVFLF